MLQIRKTDVYSAWIDDLRDIQGRARILVRIERLAAGNPGDVKPVGEGVSELRIDFGPGYRVYPFIGGRQTTVKSFLLGGNLLSSIFYQLIYDKETIPKSSI